MSQPHTKDWDTTNVGKKKEDFDANLDADSCRGFADTRLGVVRYGKFLENACWKRRVRDLC
jgi:hypothetical protein